MICNRMYTLVNGDMKNPLQDSPNAELPSSDSMAQFTILLNLNFGFAAKLCSKIAMSSLSMSDCMGLH